MPPLYCCTPVDNGGSIAVVRPQKRCDRQYTTDKTTRGTEVNAEYMRIPTLALVLRTAKPYAQEQVLRIVGNVGPREMGAVGSVSSVFLLFTYLPHLTGKMSMVLYTLPRRMCWFAWDIFEMVAVGAFAHTSFNTPPAELSHRHILVPLSYSCSLCPPLCFYPRLNPLYRCVVLIASVWSRSSFLGSTNNRAKVGELHYQALQNATTSKVIMSTIFANRSSCVLFRVNVQSAMVGAAGGGGGGRDAWGVGRDAPWDGGISSPRNK